MQINCSKTTSISKGYLCNGPQKSCRSFVTFRSKPPYDTPLSIAYLLGVEASNIVSINKNISNVDHVIPSNKLIIVPVSCSCSGNIYQHVTTYTVNNNDSQNYFQIANETYQGLTTCQALMGQNYFSNENLSSGTELKIPLRCACPSGNQTADGVKSLLVFMVAWDDMVSSIAEVFGASTRSILEANMLSENSLIYPFTPILVPLKNQFSENCTENLENSFCKCPHGYHREEMSEGLKWISHDGKRFPVKLATLLGISNIHSLLLCVFFLRKGNHLLHIVF